MSVYTCSEKTGIKTAEKLKEDILSQLDRNEELTIDFAAVRRIDLSVAQIVIAAGREAKKRNLAFRLTGLSSDVKRQLRLCGVIK